MTRSEVLVRQEGGVGRITLNRPDALHALTTEMCRTITHTLLDWRDKPDVELVLIDHAGERGFCAGGDIRMLAKSGATDGVAARRFFFVEYRLNHLLFTYPKPTAAVMDGLTLGGGVGLSLPCRYRIATERTNFALPETGIGLFPDVGAGWYLPRLPGRAGLWLALTGARLQAADCHHLGIATHVVPSAAVGPLRARIAEDPGRLEQVLTERTLAVGPAGVRARQDDVDALFLGESVEEVVDRLARAGSWWAGTQLKIIQEKSPQTLKVAFRQLELGRAATSFAAHMALEYRIAARVVQRHDFLEGVRAVIVDKDNRPAWSPAALSDVTEALLDHIFAPLPPGDEWTPLRGLDD